MEISLRHNPEYAVARLYLAPNEPLRLQTGAMMAHSPGIEIDARMEGGLMAGLKRSMLSGEGLFISSATAPPAGGWVDITPTLPGDIMPLTIQPQRPFFVSRGCWLANSYSVTTDSQWGTAQFSMLGQAGLGLQAYGQGTVLLSIYGALDIIDLQPGDQVVVDSGHVVAYDLSIAHQVRPATSGTTWHTMRSGEGYVFDFAGPGRIFLQSRNPLALAAYVRAAAPSS